MPSAALAVPNPYFRGAFSFTCSPPNLLPQIFERFPFLPFEARTCPRPGPEARGKQPHPPASAAEGQEPEQTQPCSPARSSWESARPGWGHPNPQRGLENERQGWRTSRDRVPPPHRAPHPRAAGDAGGTLWGGPLAFWVLPALGSLGRGPWCWPGAGAIYEGPRRRSSPQNKRRVRDSPHRPGQLPP